MKGKSTKFKIKQYTIEKEINENGEIGSHEEEGRVVEEE